MTPRKFVIDCDVGTDDAQAIFIALAQANVEIIAVTAVFGNASVKCTALNTLRVFHLVDRTDIPVYVGCDRAFTASTVHESDNFLGMDGFGNSHHEYVIDENLLQSEHASQALVRLARKFPGEIELIATGPLTNLAIALKLDPDFGKNLKCCYFMGGNTEGRGNKGMCAEFNFYSDPESAHAVLAGLGCPLTMAGLEICEESAFSWEWYEKFVNSPGKTAAFIKRIEQFMVGNQKAAGVKKYMAIWDQLAMAIAINDAVAIETQDVYMCVELHGTATRGQCVIDWRGTLKKKANVRIVTKIDMQLFEKLLYEGIAYNG